MWELYTINEFYPLPEILPLELKLKIIEYAFNPEIYPWGHKL